MACPLRLIKEESSGKRCKSADEINSTDDNSTKAKAAQINSDNGRSKQGKDSTAKPPEPPKDYIHVWARRGEATDSHSLAERVTREKISQRMELLQDLVPGCNKVVGKAVMVDEIINYVHSLQLQVEFLSIKLATVNPQLDFNNLSNLLPKDVQCSYIRKSGNIQGCRLRCFLLASAQRVQATRFLRDQNQSTIIHFLLSFVPLSPLALAWNEELFLPAPPNSRTNFPSPFSYTTISTQARVAANVSMRRRSVKQTMAKCTRSLKKRMKACGLKNLETFLGVADLSRSSHRTKAATAQQASTV